MKVKIIMEVEVPDTDNGQPTRHERVADMIQDLLLSHPDINVVNIRSQESNDARKK